MPMYNFIFVFVIQFSFLFLIKKLYVPPKFYPSPTCTVHPCRPMLFFWLCLQKKNIFPFLNFFPLFVFEKKKLPHARARPAEALGPCAFLFSLFCFSSTFSPTLPSLWPLSLFSTNKYRPIEPPKIIRFGLNQYFGLTRFLKEKYISPLRRDFWKLSPHSEVVF